MRIEIERTHVGWMEISDEGRDARLYHFLLGIVLVPVNWCFGEIVQSGT